MAATFVLVHGGNVGGWCWQRTARALRQQGHEVYTPTLTGYGERAHLPAAGAALDTHVDDIAGVLEFEDLEDVILVGHSYGGMVIPLVAERLPHRVKRAVWMASLVLRDGETMQAYIERSREVRKAMNGRPDAESRHWTARVQEGPARPTHPLPPIDPRHPDWVMSRVTRGPGGTSTAQGALSGFLATGIPTGYILALRDTSLVPEVCREFAGRLPGCRYLEVDAGHNLMLSRPELTAEALIEMVD